MKKRRPKIDLKMIYFRMPSKLKAIYDHMMIDIKNTRELNGGAVDVSNESIMCSAIVMMDKMDRNVLAAMIKNGMADYAEMIEHAANAKNASGDPPKLKPIDRGEIAKVDVIHRTLTGKEPKEARRFG